MFRLEKVFQNDDSGYIIFVNFTKSIFLFLISYIFVILNKHTIYDISNFNIFLTSNFFYYSISISIIYFLSSFFLKDRKVYKKNFISFLKEDLLNLIVSNVITIALLFVLKVNLIINLNLFFYTF